MTPLVDAATALRALRPAGRAALGTYAAVLLVTTLAGAALRGCGGSMGSEGIVAVVEDGFSTGVLVSHQGRVVVLTALGPVNTSNHAKAYLYRSVGDSTVPVGFAGTVVAVDREAGVAVVVLEGIRPGDVPTATLADAAPPKQNDEVTAVGSRARVASELTRVSRGKGASPIFHAKGKVAGDAEGDRGKGAFVVTGEDIGGPGFVGAPVLGSWGRVVGLTVRAGSIGPTVVPSATLKKLLDSIQPGGLEEAKPDSVSARLQEKLKATQAQVRASERRWRSLSWPQLSTDPRPDRLVHLKGLPKLDDLIAPTDLARLNQEARGAADALRERQGKRKGAARIDVTDDDYARGLGFKQLTAIFGAEPVVIERVEQGPAPRTYVVDLRFGEDEVREACAKEEHGQIFVSTRDCSGKEYAWLADRHAAQLLLGAWKPAQSEAEAAQPDPCDKVRDDWCLQRDSLLTISKVTGTRIEGTLRARVRVVSGNAYGETVTCLIGLEEEVTGSVVGGVARLVGRRMMGDIQHQVKNEKPEESLRGCERVQNWHTSGDQGRYTMGYWAVPAIFRTPHGGKATAQPPKDRYWLDLQIPAVSPDSASALFVWRANDKPFLRPEQRPFQELRWVPGDGSK
ncbi:MAG: trypsin-like peptidase domain-containing protein [Polyangiaceae bacterium]|nr:trypsin-like peptidase domain-containing protein [Polyangiaceae bacterium]